MTDNRTPAEIAYDATRLSPISLDPAPNLAPDLKGWIDRHLADEVAVAQWIDQIALAADADRLLEQAADPMTAVLEWIEQVFDK